ncbi:hypothetical protein, partial [Burkholderia ambifaria]|uniref:hypothetical protein n=1 Tax=Burkholderia ambifaria TaxID=152480 RepID=UPI0012FD3A9E
MGFLNSARTEVEIPLEIGRDDARGIIYANATRSGLLGYFKLMIALDGRIYLLMMETSGAPTGKLLMGTLDLQDLRIRLSSNWRAGVPKGSVLIVENPHSSSDEVRQGKVLDSALIDDLLLGEAIKYVAVVGQQSREFRSWWEKDHSYYYGTLSEVVSSRAEYRQMVATELAKPAYDPTRGRMTEGDKKSIAGIQAAHDRILDELQKESRQRKVGRALADAITKAGEDNKPALVYALNNVQQGPDAGNLHTPEDVAQLVKVLDADLSGQGASVTQGGKADTFP